jgi:nitrilase
MIVDPWGSVAAVREQEGPGVVLADIGAARLAQVRGQLPARNHRVL